MKKLFILIWLSVIAVSVFAQPLPKQDIYLNDDPGSVINGLGLSVPFLSFGASPGSGSSSLNFSDQFTLSGTGNTSVAIGPNVKLTNTFFIGNSIYAIVEAGTNAGTFNLDASLSSEVTMSLAGNATVGITNWSDGHPFNFVITNTGSFSITITNTVLWIGSGTSTQPAIEQGAGIVNIYHMWQTGGRIMGSLEGRSSGYIRFPIQLAYLPTTSPARLATNSNAGLKFLQFATNETCYFQFTMPQDYGLSPSLRIPYSSSGGTSGNVSFSVSVWAQTPGDALNADTESYDTANVGSKAVPGTLNFPDSIVIALTTIDTMAPGDLVALKITSTTPSSLNDIRVRGDMVLEYLRK